MRACCYACWHPRDIPLKARLRDAQRKTPLNDALNVIHKNNESSGFQRGAAVVYAPAFKS